MVQTDATTNFDAEYAIFQSALSGTLRREIILELMREKTFAEALSRLRAGMRSNTFKTATTTLNFEKTIRALDNRTRQDGFHALHDWDGKAMQLNKDTIPVDVLTYLASLVRPAPPNEAVLAILLDYYFAYALALLSLRAWDDPDSNAALDRVSELVQVLQGEQGSGQRFTANAESLIFIATSHFEPDDSAYNRLLQRVRSLDEPPQIRFALVHAAILGSHLRFGFDAQYNRDVGHMRIDNAPDYLWVCFALITLMRAYARLHDAGVQNEERQRIIEGLLNALTTDTRAFVGNPPASLASMEAEHSEFRELLLKYRTDLLAEFESHRPAPETYSPICFNFNFPHNLLKAMVVDALIHGEPSRVSFNDLLTRFSSIEDIEDVRWSMIHRLLGYARSSPDTIRGKPMPIITYDPYGGVRVFTRTMNLIKEGI